ncbi:MAG: hypothetical protein RL722_1999 [Pseudomonadota bacterium]|jgi:hypothetical protein
MGPQTDPPKYLPPLDPALARRFARLDDNQKEWFSERAAMREYLAEGVSRRQAEAGAWDDLVRYFQLGD